MLETSITSFVAKQRQLLALELEAESEDYTLSDNEARPRTLRNLEVSGVSVGLYGRAVAELQVCTVDGAPSNHEQARRLPPHPFSAGDEVELRAKSTSSNPPRGIVCEVSDFSISIALSEKIRGQGAIIHDSNGGPESADGILSQKPLVLVHRNSAEVHRKLMDGLMQLEKSGADHPVAGRVIKTIFSSNEAHTTIEPDPDITFMHQGLDASQKEAIRFALNPARSTVLIHGPPGTGKTTTLVELIRQAVYHQNMKVLVTAPSNVAVDNIVERLADQGPTTMRKNRKDRRRREKGLKIVRLGHPARIKDSTRAYSLEALIQSADGTEIVADIRKELQTYFKVSSNPKSQAGDRRAAYREIKTLRKEIRGREEKVVQDLVTSAQVVLATTVGSASRILDRVVDGFDLVVIDEAAQALEASCWLPILRGKKTVLCGDHLQLPPTIKSNLRKVQAGLGRTLFERLMKHDHSEEGSRAKVHDNMSRMLKTQYRMHQEIADWASTAMYKGELETHTSVAARTLAGMECVQNGENVDFPNVLATPMVLIDTAGCEMYEAVNEAGSKSNAGEARLVQSYAEQLVHAGVPEDQLCVITPYSGQVELLKGLLQPSFPKIEVRTVDGFQGGEREAVILSLVRSSTGVGQSSTVGKGIGFLSDDRRQNVAVTRAKRHVAVVCDTDTVAQSAFIKSLIDWIAEHGQHLSAMEFAPAFEKQHGEVSLPFAEASTSIKSKPKAHNSVKTVQDTTKHKPATSDDKGNSPERKRIFDKIDDFANCSAPGDTLDIGKELSDYDRRAAVELAQQLGLQVQGDGSDAEEVFGQFSPGRTNLVFVRKQPESREMPSSEEQTQNVDDTSVKEPTNKPQFAALMDEDDESSKSSSSVGLASLDGKTAEDDAIETPQASGQNALLAQLAKERSQRQQGLSSKEISSSQSKPKRGQKGKGNRLGGRSKAKQQQKLEGEELDDMAFLDAQIDIVQNSHGRRVAGRGKGYRTLINGILNAAPPAVANRKDERSAVALRAKLREAEKARKPKGKKGKKK